MMEVTLTIGWWLLPAFVSITAIWWMLRQDYGGNYNFTALFTVPMAGFVIMTAWAIYFAIGWALS